MDRRHVEWLVASSIYLLAVLAVFHDYLPFWKRVHIWSDTEGFHWPLLQYAHRAFQEGRFPLWDPSIYCGIPFAGNIQAGLFYPPNWLLFIANALRSHIPYQAVEILAFAHVWFASVMGAAWLRLRTVHWLPALLGGASVGFSGYMLSQLTHLGMISGYAWIPFGLWGIQQANDQSAQHPQAWRLLWKPALAIAMVLLAGYPAMAGVAGLVFLAYAAALPRRL
ncbi:MAG: hypothetical protein MUF01_03685, partial [Bryobacterales bacterium]|nr:hypothetical protein [Bryobacterales bacterium]